ISEIRVGLSKERARSRRDSAARRLRCFPLGRCRECRVERVLRREHVRITRHGGKGREKPATSPGRARRSWSPAPKRAGTRSKASGAGALSVLRSSWADSVVPCVMRKEGLFLQGWTFFGVSRRVVNRDLPLGPPKGCERTAKPRMLERRSLPIFLLPTLA